MNPHPAIQLPRTIEGARIRYIRIYKDLFKGSSEERSKLLNKADVKLLTIRRHAPKFYELHLPHLVNQVGSMLLTCDVNTHDGQKKFHETHRDYILILKELINTQPSGEINFNTEMKRIQERQKLLEEKQRLSQELSVLRASEISLDEESDEENDTYEKIGLMIEAKKKRLLQVDAAIAIIEGEQVREDQIEFELIIKKGTVLEKLGEENHIQIEQHIRDFLQKNQKKRRAFDIDMKEIISQVDLSNVNLNNDDFMEMLQELITAFRNYMREREMERINLYYDAICQDTSLRPREGLILDDPNNIPPEVEAKLQESKEKFESDQNKINEIFRRKDVDEGLLGKDEGCTDDEESDDFILTEVRERIEKEPDLFVRVKEEPLDESGDVSEDSDDDCQELGVVEPAQKYQCIDIDSD